MTKPLITKDLMIHAEEYTLQFKDGLITEAEWVIDLFLQHHGKMRV